MSQSLATLFLAHQAPRVWMGLDGPSQSLIIEGTQLWQRPATREPSAAALAYHALLQQPEMICKQPIKLAGPHYGLIEPQAWKIIHGLSAILDGALQAKHVDGLVAIIRGAVHPPQAFRVIEGFEVDALRRGCKGLPNEHQLLLQQARDQTVDLRAGPKRPPPNGHGILAW